MAEGSAHGAADDQNLTARTVAGVRWTYVSTGFGAVIQLGFAVVVSRLLPEAAFGLLAAAQFGLRFAAYFARMGVSQALVQKRELTELEVRAGWTSGTGLGLLAVVAFWFLAPLAPEVFTQVGREFADELVVVTRLMSLTILFAGMQMTSLALLQRELRFKDIALIEVGSYLVGYYALGLPVAAVRGGVEALVVANLAQWVIVVVATYARAPHPVRPTFARAAYRELYAFGGKVSITGVFEYTSENLDTAAIARYEGAAAAGSYNRAYTLVALPMYYLTNSLNEVLFPSFSRLIGDDDRLRRTYLSSVAFSAALLWPTCAGIAVASAELVPVVLGPGWEQVVPILPIITAATAMHFLSTLDGTVLTATARLDAKLRIEVCYVVFLGGLMLLAVGRGEAAYAVALAVGEVLRHAVFVVLMGRALGVGVRAHLGPYGRAAAAAALVAAAIAGVRWVLAVQLDLPAALVLLAEVATGGAALAACLRAGPLRPIGADLRARLESAGALEGGRLASAARAVLGG
jgi:lipopolysaccharide exporter